MVKVITYGTYDLLHHGHVALLQRAKALGDYLIVGVTSEDFDKARGKLNVRQSLMERIEAVRALGIADEIIIEEYEGQKIDDIIKYGADIFAIGSDWAGHFDYLKEYCEVVYLPRTEGISSTDVRAKSRFRIFVDGDTPITKKFKNECSFVNGVEVTDDFDAADAVYVLSLPGKHYETIKNALLADKHVLFESPIALSKKDCESLFLIAGERGLILMEGIKTAYSTAYNRLMLLAKSGEIGEIVSVDATCSSLRDLSGLDLEKEWNTMTYWGVTGLLPVFQLLGTDYRDVRIVSRYADRALKFDGFTKIDFIYPNAVASVKAAECAKSEGSLVITGTKGYIYVPAPWWKTDYFEVRFEDMSANKKYFYQLEGEGIRYEILAFRNSVEYGRNLSRISENITSAIAGIVELSLGDTVVEI